MAKNEFKEVSVQSLGFDAEKPSGKQAAFWAAAMRLGVGGALEYGIHQSTASNQASVASVVSGRWFKTTVRNGKVYIYRVA